MRTDFTADFVPPHHDSELDTQGLSCPEPVMLLHAEVRRQSPGQIILVTATDPSTQRDIPRFCHFLGHELVAQEQRDDRFEYWVKVAGTAN
ncbi:MAG: sulfurtransferase TusA [Natronospirillum sp.]